MSIDFMKNTCQTASSRKKFGLCDNPPPAKDPAYIDEFDGAKWIAVVINEYDYDCTFTAIDNCIDVFRPDGKMAQRCDGVLTYDDIIAFVELKQRAARGNKWVEDAEEQLKETISYFEASDGSDDYKVKKAYISTSEHPKFKETQLRRMNQFQIDTGYVLRIESRITLL